jgi:hypothetical protein
VVRAWLDEVAPVLVRNKIITFFNTDDTLFLIFWRVSKHSNTMHMTRAESWRVMKF